MPGAKIIQILTCYLSFLSITEMSPGFIHFCGTMWLVCKFKWPRTYVILYIKNLHVFKGHIEVIDKKNNKNSKKEKGSQLSCEVLGGEGVKSLSGCQAPSVECSTTWA